MSEGEEGDEEGPEVRYIPGTQNRYSYEDDVILLDENLKEYPRAHDEVLEHERQHAKPECKTLLGFLRHEFRTDLRFYFDSDDQVEEVRRYYRNRSDSRLDIRTHLVLSVGNLIRDLWRPVLHFGKVVSRKF